MGGDRYAWTDTCGADRDGAMVGAADCWDS